MENYAAYTGSEPLKTPPQSVEAERSVLGALMKDNNALMTAMEMMTEDDFYQPQHAAIFKAMRSLYQQPRAVDLVTMDDELSRTGMLLNSYVMCLRPLTASIAASCSPARLISATR